MLAPFLHEIVHNKCEGSSAFDFRHIKQLDLLFGPVLLKVKSRGFDRILVVEPLLACNTCPSVTDSLLCEDYIVTS